VTTVTKRYASIQIAAVLGGILAAVSCARIVTDQDIPCDPGCPAGYECQYGMCRDTQIDTQYCGYYVPGHLDAGELCKIPNEPDGAWLGCDPGDDCPAEMAQCPGCADALPTFLIVLEKKDLLFLDRHEVTNAQYLAYLEAMTPRPQNPDCDEQGAGIWGSGEPPFFNQWLGRHPVVCVNAEDAVNYCEWAGKRLPSEEEWELGARGYSARIYPWNTGGSQNQFFPGKAQCRRCPAGIQSCWEQAGDQSTHCSQIEFYDERLDICGPDAEPKHYCETTAPVLVEDQGELVPSRAKQNTFDLLHMSGNVAEWVSDGRSGAFGIVRGGSFEDNWEGITGWSRDPVELTRRAPHIGFRCAWSALEW